MFELYPRWASNIFPLASRGIYAFGLFWSEVLKVTKLKPLFCKHRYSPLLVMPYNTRILYSYGALLA